MMSSSDPRPLTESRSAIVGSCVPEKAYFEPGEPGRVRLCLQESPARMRLSVVDLDGVVYSDEVIVHNPEETLTFPLPSVPCRGYGVELAPLGGTNEVLERHTSAVDVQRTWTDVPRYGFLSDFAPDAQYGERCDGLLSRHITAVQFYDWMYRHYQFLPASDDRFIDALGRCLSLDAVRAAIGAVRQRGMASLAYGALYGAEPEYAMEHPEELLYDALGKPISLVELFYITDLRTGPWRDRILEQFKLAVNVGFDGIHADQYGFPERAWDYHKTELDMAPIFADMIAAAHRTVTAAGGDGVIFNNVRNWPIRNTAPVEQCATYIEVWPPYECFEHLVQLIEQARVLAPRRHVILAAYMSCAKDDPAAAEEATLLTSSVIHAAGGFHLLLGEGNGILVDPYYPNFVRPPEHFQRRLADHWNFIVQYHAYLYDNALVPWSGEPVQVEGLWPIYRTGDRFSTVSLITTSPASAWDSIRRRHPPRRGVTMTLAVPRPVVDIHAVSPDFPGETTALQFEVVRGTLRLVVPAVATWTLLILRHG